ncbi:MAG TPA: helix-turn-helix domain-containing protein [Candidatus Angelobacter sp.]|nr:helix-turn-helix domain-containing protein [Candidatus Angelobacter sp.]
MLKVYQGQPRGVLRLRAEKGRFQYSRHLPAPDLSYFIEHYWIITWDLRGCEPFLQETLPHPSVHLVVQEGRSGIYGIVKGKFSILLEGKSRVFGVKFRPGVFYPFFNSPVSRLTGKIVEISSIFGNDGQELEKSILALDDPQKEQMIEIAGNFLRKRLPQKDPNIALAAEIISQTVADRQIVKVEDIVDRFGINKRTLQRLFSRYVGASPKWVIQRFRLVEAAEQLASGKIVDGASLALQLGYFDQAHFVRDFKAIVGQAPAEYAKSLRPSENE